MIKNSDRLEAYESIMRNYLGDELIQNVYERMKLMDDEFVEKEERIADLKKAVVDESVVKCKDEIKECVRENVKSLCLEMYKQGFRDAVDLLKGV